MTEIFRYTHDIGHDLVRVLEGNTAQPLQDVMALCISQCVGMQQKSVVDMAAAETLSGQHRAAKIKGLQDLR